MEPSDEALVLACRRGESTAWDLLVDRYRQLIFTIARRAGLDEEQAADTMQRVFTILLERLDTIAQPAQVGAWLAVTTRREAWLLRRRERLASAGSSDRSEELAALPDEGDLPDELVQRLEVQHRVRLAVAHLDERCRRLMTMLFFQAEPQPYAEIARAMGMREGAIGPTRARCLQKLRRLLGDEEL